MKVESFSGAETFLDRASPYLQRDEARSSLLYSVALHVAKGDVYGREPPRFACVRTGERVHALALRTPPHRVLVHAVDREPRALRALARHLVSSDPLLSGVHGERDAAEAFARAWESERGDAWSTCMEQCLYHLEGLPALPNVPGAFRLAMPADRSLLASWVDAFSREASSDSPAPDSKALVDRHTAAGTLAVWVRERPVSMAVCSRTTPNGASISLVYTPPEHRGLGFAQACVSSLSRCQLQAGKSFCVLFADRANPVSNAVYRAVGYRPLASFLEIAFASSDGRRERIDVPV